MIFGRLEPTEIAASTYGSSRADSTTERTSRAARGISGIVIATSTVHRLAPDSATTAMASRMLGIAIRPSMIRISTASIHLKKPETRPITSPMATLKIAAPSPIRSETRPP